MCEKIDYRGEQSPCRRIQAFYSTVGWRCPHTLVLRYASISEQHLLVLRLLIHEAFLRMRKLPQLVSNHILGNRHRQVVLSVMHEETDPNEMRQDSARTRIRFYGSVVRKRFPEIREGNEVRSYRPS
jgi:hypothetical protein